MPDQAIDTTDRLCQNCGYNLRGLAENRCPECGEAFDPNRPSGAPIPWLQRQAIGRWRAYWLTVAMAMFHPLKLGRELWDAQIVDPKGAAGFRRVLVLQCLACVPIFVIALGISRNNYRELFAAAVLCVVGLAIFLLVATDSTISLLDASEQSWMRALGDYACAPLAVFPGIMLLAYLGMWNADFWMFVAVPAFLAMIVWWWITTVLVMRASDTTPADTFGRILVIPMWWAISAILGAMSAALLAHLVYGVMSFLP